MYPPSTEAAHTRRLYVLVVLFAILPYLNSLGGGFTFDDMGLIRDNPIIQSEPVRRVLGAVYYPGALYRPLTMLTYVANARVSQAPLGYHIVNVALHALVSVAAFTLARMLLHSTVAATVTAVLFAVHPIHTEAVSSIVGRAELLAALFVLTALLAFVRAERVRAKPVSMWRAFSLIAFAAGMLSKESAFTAILLLALVYWWIEPERSLRRLLVLSLPYLTVGLGFLGLRLAVVGSLALPAAAPFLDNPLAHVPGLPRLQTAVVVLWEYLSQLAVPLHLSADYSFNEIPLVSAARDPRFALAAVVLIGLVLGLGLAAKRAPALLLAAGFTVIPLALTANLLFPIGTIKAERLLYLPSFGWCLAWGWLAGLASQGRRRWWVPILALVVAAYGARTWARNQDWRDNLSLFGATVTTSPGSAKAHHNLGVAYEQAGKWDLAMLHFRRALAIYPDYADAAFNIGRLYHRKGLDAGALHWYAEAMQRDWGRVKAHRNTGLIRYRAGEYASAEAAFRSGLDSDPDNPRLLIGLSLAVLAQARPMEAYTILAQVDANEIRTAETLDHLADAQRRLVEATRQ